MRKDTFFQRIICYKIHFFKGYFENLSPRVLKAYNYSLFHYKYLEIEKTINALQALTDSLP